MRFVLLFLALVALVAAASSAVPGDGAKSRVRRHILPWGWDVDGLLHNIKSKVHHTLYEVKEKVHEGLAAAKNFLKYAFSWLNFKHSEPHTAQETIYFLHPGAVRIISFTGTGPHASDSHRLTWDGHHLAWEKNDELHGGDVTAEERLLIFFDGIDHPVPLVVLAKFLNHLHAGSIITVELRGSKLDDLRLVLHAKSKDHDNETTTVKVDHLLKKAHAFFRKHDREQHHKSSNGNEMHWDGHRLSWPNKGKSAHLRVTVSSSNAKATHVIPLSVLAEHLKGVPARDVRLEVHGKTLKDMRVELHVSRHRTISVPVKKLIEEANTTARTDNEQSHPLGNTHDNTVRSHSPTNTHDNTAQSHSPTNTHDNTVQSHSPTNTDDNTAQSHLPANTHYDTVQSHSPTNTDDNKVHTQRESDTKSVN